MNVLAGELAGIADRLTVILPWGVLLEDVAVPKIESLRDIAALCLPDASIEIVMSHDERNDERLEEQHMESLPRLYRHAGLRVNRMEKIGNRDLEQYETTWAKRLAFGRPREVWRILARYHSAR